MLSFSDENRKSYQGEGLKVTVQKFESIGFLASSDKNHMHRRARPPAESARVRKPGSRISRPRATQALGLALSFIRSASPATALVSCFVYFIFTSFVFTFSMTMNIIKKMFTEKTLKFGKVTDN